MDHIPTCPNLAGHKQQHHRIDLVHCLNQATALALNIFTRDTKSKCGTSDLIALSASGTSDLEHGYHLLKMARRSPGRVLQHKKD